MMVAFRTSVMYLYDVTHLPLSNYDMYLCTVYYYLFAVARWLVCLLSDYKSVTCSER